MECPSCGAKLISHASRCPVCGKPTLYFHRQRRCLHCGTPAAELAKTCLMCGKPVDSLPLKSSIFSGSWLGIGLGVLIIVGIVVGVTRYQNSNRESAQAAQNLRGTPSRTPTMTLTPGPPHTPTATATITPTPSPTPRTHIIEAGENPSYIADLYGVTVDALIALNNIEDVRALHPGQTLLIPPSTGVDSSAEPAALPPQIVYRIESGDTLLGIALAHGTSVEAIAAVNPDTNLDLIFPGQELVVPLATPTSTPSPTATLTPTSTPGPPNPAPVLLSPVEGQVITGDTLFLNWTVTDLLADDEFYVLQLTWSDGSRTDYWTQTSSWRLNKEQRPIAGPISCTVTIMRRTGLAADGTPSGVPVTDPDPPRLVNWP